MTKNHPKAWDKKSVDFTDYVYLLKISYSEFDFT